VIPITVVMRSYNDAGLLPRTLAGLAAQQGVAWTLSVFESASTDDSPALLQRFIADHGGEAAGHRFTALAAGSYRSSRVLNAGVRAATTELVVFLNSDAVLMGSAALLKLVEPFAADARLAGTFATQVERAGAAAVTRLDHEVAFRQRHRLGAAATWVSLVCSAIRRSAWDAVPFDERLTYAEDAVWSVHVARHGWRTRYVPEAVVEHSHDYTPAQRRRRAYGDAAALAVIAKVAPPPDRLRGVVLPLLRRIASDLRLALGCGRPWWALTVIPQRWAQVDGAWAGSRAGWQQVHAPGSATHELPRP
jgi:rhamnosyltransferase